MSPFQKSSRNMNWNRRGVPVPTAPLFSTFVIRPKVESVAMLPAGLA